MYVEQIVIYKLYVYRYYLICEYLGEYRYVYKYIAIYYYILTNNK